MALNIKDIQKFCNDANANYAITVPADTTMVGYNAVRSAIEELDLPGRFVIVSEDVAIKPVLKLYVWTGFNSDWTGGLAVAIAGTVDEAKKRVEAEQLYVRDWGELTIHELDAPGAWCVDGGT